MTTIKYDNVNNKVELTFTKGVRVKKDVTRKVAAVFTYKGDKVLRLFVCNPDINELGLSVELLGWAKENDITRIAWYDQKEGNVWKYVDLDWVLGHSEIREGKETNDYVIASSLFVPFETQHEKWMIKLFYRNFWKKGKKV